MKQIVDGNIALSKVAYLFSEVASIYPITPSSPMASNIDFLSHGDHYNLFHDKVKLVEMQSEAGAAGAMHGALITGSLATTFTASQGLLLMIPNMYKMAGEMLPGVIHVASRTVATHALSIFGDHSDIYATRGTGFCMLASSSVEDAQNLGAVAHLAAMKSSLPFLHFFDGFRTSHELNTITSLKEEDLLSLVPTSSVQQFRNRSLNVHHPIERGMAENEDIYFQNMKEINLLAHTNYAPFTYYGDELATNVIVAMGSVNETLRLVIDEERKKGRKIGCIEVHLYRPFSEKYFFDVLPNTVENIAVLDRVKEPGSNGEPLYLDIVNVLKGKNIQVVGGRYGLSSKNTTPAMIKSIFDMLDGELKNNFTVGIIDNVTNTSLEWDESYTIDLNDLEVKVYGFGSDGMVGASKDLLHIIGENSESYVQGYFEYDSKKSGGVTVSNLRIADHPIHAPYYVTNPNIIVVAKEEYFEQFAILSEVQKNAILLINTANPVSIFEKMSSSDLKQLQENHVSVVAIDGLLVLII